MKDNVIMREKGRVNWMVFLLLLVFTGLFTGFILPILYLLYCVFLKPREYMEAR